MRKVERGRARWQPLGHHQKVMPYILVTPLLAAGALFLLYPIVSAIVTSFTSFDLLKPDEPLRFVGLQHYREIFVSGDFALVLRHTLIYTLGTVFGSIGLGLCVALLLNQKFVGRKAVRALLTIPWTVPAVAAGLMWTYIFDQQLGIANYLLQAFRIVAQPVRWLDAPEIAMMSVLIVKLWLSFPFPCAMLLGALQTVPRELLEAASLDGANRYQCLRYVTVPCIRPVLNILFLLTTVWAFKDFDLIYVLTEGGPARATDTLAVETFRSAFTNVDFAKASAYGTLTLLLSLVFSILYVRFAVESSRKGTM